MAYLYFDETIRESGGFILGALVVAECDLSPVVVQEWNRLGMDATSNEYKSSNPKADNHLAVAQRNVMIKLLHQAKLGLTVAPALDRRRLGEYCTQLLIQLIDTSAISQAHHVVYIDESIPVAADDMRLLRERNVHVIPDCNSTKIAGLQLADHAAHFLGSMLLEEMGVLKKQVNAGEGSGYHPDEKIALGFELWASLRYALIGRNEYIQGLSPLPDDPANPFFRVDGVGLYIAKSCSIELAEHARSRFGVNYLGCIH